MATKPDKEKKSPGKTGSASAKESAKKTSPKPGKQMEEDDEDEEMDEENNPNAMQEDPPLPQPSLTAGQSQNGSEPPESGSAGSLTQGAGPTV